MFLLLFTVSCVEPEMELNEGELDNAKSIDFSTVSISSNNTNPNAAQIGDTITVYYSSNKTLSNSDVLIQSQKAMVEDLGGNNYKATYTLAASDAEGMITFNIVVKDFKNDVTETINASTDASSVFFDTIIPTVSIVSVSSNNLMSSLAKVGDTISLSFTGSETLQNISVLIDGNTALVSNTGGDNWLATYVMNVGGSSGVLNYSINYQDLGYNAGSNITATTDATSVTFDNVEPTPVISTGESSPTNASPISYSVDFGEDVSGFVLGDIVVGNGTAGSFSGGPQVYTFDVTPAGMGTVKIDIAAGVGEDLASNLSLIATQYSITYDNLGPTPVISTSENNPTNDSTLSYSIDFGETVTGFSLSDISVGNGVKSNFAGTTQVYTFDVTPSGQGSVTVDIAAAVAIDNLSN